MIKPFHWITAHKAITTVVAIAVVGGGYYYYSQSHGTTTSTQYTTANVEKGTLVVSVTGSGQIAALNQVDIKPEASGRLISLNVHDGEYVAQGQLLGTIDTSDAEKTIRDSQVSLDSAKLQLSILKQSSANIEKLTQDGYNEVVSAFLDAPTIITGLNTIVYDNTIASYTNLVDAKDADLVRPLIRIEESGYESARTAYDKAFADYHTISRTDSTEKIKSFINETSDMALKMSDAIKNMTNLIDYINDYNTKNNRTLAPAYANLLVKYKSNLSSYTSTMNPHITSLSSIRSSIENAPLNIASQELSITQKENSLSDAKSAITKYSVRAPFAGLIASVSSKVGDNISPSTAFATMISSSRYAGISLNEVDITKIKLGQKATLTFDALENYSITGQVIDIDTIGTTSQGVVTYTVKVGFDTSDTRIKPGMSATASIITDVKQDVLMVPNAAVKTSGGAHYVEILSSASSTDVSDITATSTTTRTPVEIGAYNDTMTEILSGAKEGDAVVTKTSTATTQTTTTQQRGGMGIPGLGGFGR